ncbi:MAG: MATE family efflux transporter [Spirochaetaceae bacterium]|jgi:putative MATE family efflux protein|nr:MATE family efflux transporter [Spirochaetaceae bacterium]
MLQNLINSLVNMADTVMVGRLGTAAIAACGLGNQIFFLFTMLLFGVCSGAGTFTAQFWGKKDIQGIRKNTGLCLAITLAVGALFTLAAFFIPDKLIACYSRDTEVIELGARYLHALTPAFLPFAVSFVFIMTLRSIEQVALAMVTTIISLSVNVVLNYFLIFGSGPFPELGVAGAAMATAAARIIEMLILVSVSYAKKYALAGSFRDLAGFNRAFTGRFIRIAFPVVVNEAFWSLGITVENAIFARTHTDAIAALNITATISNLTWVFFMGFGAAVSVMVGKKIGEGDEGAARLYAKKAAKFAPLAALSAALVLVPVSRALPFFFNVNEQVLRNTQVMFIVLSCAYPFRAFNLTMIVGVCRAGGDTLFCAFYDILPLWLVAIPAAWIAARVPGLPIWGIYLCLCMEEPVKLLVGLSRLKSGRWLHHVT